MIQSLPIVVYLAAALVVTRIPFVKTYFCICYTVIYGVIRVLVSGGKSSRIRLIKNNSVPETSDSFTFKNDVISYISYTAASLAAIGLFYLVSTKNYHLILYILIGLIAVSTLFWIRHFLEFLWALSFIALLAAPLYFGYEIVIMPAAIFLASYILIQSVLNAINFFIESFSIRKKTGIAAKVKSIPSVILGFVLLGQSLFTGYFIVSNFVLHIGLPWANFESVQIPWV